MKKKKQTKKFKSKVKADRVVRAPVAVQFVSKASQPRIRTNAKSDSCVIKHREMVGALNFSGTPQNGFPIQSLTVNPGRATFPWLSTQAKGWERYKFKKLKFSFHPYMGTMVNGNIFYSSEFDVDDAPPTSVLQMLQNRRSAQAPIWKSFDIVLTQSELHPGGKEFFVFSSGVAKTPTNVDCARIDIATDIAPGSTNVGYIYVEYEVEFRIQQPTNVAQTSTIDYGICRTEPASAQATYDGATPSAPTIEVMRVQRAIPSAPGSGTLSTCSSSYLGSNTVSPTAAKVGTHDAYNLTQMAIPVGASEALVCNVVPCDDTLRSYYAENTDRVVAQHSATPAIRLKTSQTDNNTVNANGIVIEEDGMYDVVIQGAIGSDGTGFAQRLVYDMGVAGANFFNTGKPDWELLSGYLHAFDGALEIEKPDGSKIEYRLPNVFNQANVGINSAAPTPADVIALLARDAGKLGKMTDLDMTYPTDVPPVGSLYASVIPYAAAAITAGTAPLVIKFAAATYPNCALPLKKGYKLFFKFVPIYLSKSLFLTSYGATVQNFWQDYLSGATSTAFFGQRTVPAADFTTANLGPFASSFATLVNNLAGIMYRLFPSTADQASQAAFVSPV